MRDLEQAKQPVTLLAGRYGHPLHPALVGVPIGAWVASLVFDIGSHVVNDPAFLVQGSRWLIAVGVVGALLAALVGFLDFFAIPTGTKVWRIGLVHMSINLVVTAIYVMGFFLRADLTGPVGWGPLVLSAVSLAALGVSGFLGGEMAYRYGVRVADETTQQRGYERTS